MKPLLTIIVFAALIFSCESTDVPFDYSIDQKLSCFCPPDGEIRLFVLADSIADAIRVDDGSRLPQDRWLRYRTISDLFEEIEKCDTSKFSVTASYDASYNYPTYVSVSAKPILVDSVTVIIEDANFAYHTRNYRRYR